MRLTLRASSAASAARGTTVRRSALDSQSRRTLVHALQLRVCRHCAAATSHLPNCDCVSLSSRSPSSHRSTEVRSFVDARISLTLAWADGLTPPTLSTMCAKPGASSQRRPLRRCSVDRASSDGRSGSVLAWTGRAPCQGHSDRSEHQCRVAWRPAASARARFASSSSPAVLAPRACRPCCALLVLLPARASRRRATRATRRARPSLLLARRLGSSARGPPFGDAPAAPRSATQSLLAECAATITSCWHADSGRAVTAMSFSSLPHDLLRDMFIASRGMDIAASATLARYALLGRAFVQPAQQAALWTVKPGPQLTSYLERYPDRGRHIAVLAIWTVQEPQAVRGQHSETS